MFVSDYFHAEQEMVQIKIRTGEASLSIGCFISEAIKDCDSMRDETVKKI